MLLRWIQKVKLHHAARLYAAKLKPQLFKSFGVAEHYTSGQIITAVKKAGLPPAYIEIAYAAFLAQDDFFAQIGNPNAGRYDELRDLYRSYLPSNLSSAYGEPESAFSGSSPASPD